MKLSCNVVVDTSVGRTIPLRTIWQQFWQKPRMYLGSSLVLLLFAGIGCAQEKPYFVTYSQDLEEPGNLEVQSKTVQAAPKYGNAFISETVEFEYGATAWWTTEVYLSGQHTFNDSTVFGGWRWENRFKPLATEHAVNPILYVEYEDINLAEKSILEVTGHASIADYYLTNAQARNSLERSLEMKLILGSNFKGFNFSENFIAEKEFSSDPWEFGYALGVIVLWRLPRAPSPVSSAVRTLPSEPSSTED